MQNDDAPKSILAQVRADGYRDGVGQASLIDHDDAYYKGQQSVWEDAPSRLRWFLFGAITTALITWWLI